MPALIAKQLTFSPQFLAEALVAKTTPQYRNEPKYGPYSYEKDIFPQARLAFPAYNKRYPDNNEELAKYFARDLNNKDKTLLEAIYKGSSEAQVATAQPGEQTAAESTGAVPVGKPVSTMAGGSSGVSAPRLPTAIHNIPQTTLNPKAKADIDQALKGKSFQVPKIPSSFTNVAKNFGSRAGVFFQRNMGKYLTVGRIATVASTGIGAIAGAGFGPMGVFAGAGLGAITPSWVRSGGATRFLGNIGNGAINAGSRLSNQVAGTRGTIAKGSSKKLLIGLLLLLLGVGMIVGLTGSATNPNEQTGSTPNTVTGDLDQKCNFTTFSISSSNSVDDNLLKTYVDRALASGKVKTEEQKNLLLPRAQFIRDQAQSVGLNPAIFLGYWESESGFSDYTHPGVRPGMDLGCDPTNRAITTFEENVLCAVGKGSVSNSRTSQCAVSQDINSSACQAITFQQAEGVKLPINTLKDFLDSYGSKVSDPNNIRSDNIVKQNIADLGLVSCNATAVSPGTTGKFVYYCQGNTSTQQCLLGQAGCGPTSVAMVLSTFGLNQTPTQVDDAFQSNGWRACGDSPSSLITAIHSSWFRNLGMEIGPNLTTGSSLKLATAEVKKFLDQGYLIIASSDQFPCVQCKSSSLIDHIFVIDGIDIASNTVDIRDPNNCSYADGDDEIQTNRTRSVDSFPWTYAYPVKKVR